jgi:N-acetyl-anhydromuramyl-L-alanine amidase AmpD
MNYLSERSPKPEDRKNTVSVHFVIGPDGECGKIGDPRDILWHAGNGSWGKTPNVNYVMMGIEVVGF